MEDSTQQQQVPAIPAEAVEAAAIAMEDAALSLIGSDLGTIYRNDIARLALEAAAPYIRAQALREAAEAMDGDDANSFYYTRKRELSHPYSKPLNPHHWGELDGIESAAKFLRSRAEEN